MAETYDDGGANGRDTRPAAFVRAFDRGLDILTCFSEHSAALSVSEVAAKAGLDRKTARRLLYTLEALGYVARDDALYRLTPKTLELGYARLVRSSFAELAQYYMDELAERIDQSCSLGIFDGQAALFIARAAVHRVMTISLRPGTRVPAYASAMGRALLSGLSAQELAHYLRETQLTAHTDRTITDPDKLRTEIEHVRQNGWALLDQELEIGVRSIATPVRDHVGRIIAAISVGTHAQLVEEHELTTTILPAMLDCATAIQQDLTAQPAVLTGTNGRASTYLLQ
ncbi:IclR family transcriptional regulator domain-containing protein [Actinoallomurus iriomotensis]|uniref:Glycerol operon regulatory protein n=1 Tax=Actinoallomurus iriomotensis TaxID=478107 RepID=A0A9W6SF52_9ACTN|nr:IclR family transcriptional regulator C-terminal domain-containing protein [Actinoallomurus iriomotensis]GLY92298.1 IclR family transcriptional regulator [Actinoallomurus iriomotensis]